MAKHKTTIINTFPNELYIGLVEGVIQQAFRDMRGKRKKAIEAAVWLYLDACDWLGEMGLDGVDPRVWRKNVLQTTQAKDKKRCMNRI